jgi:hypothetical protein
LYFTCVCPAANPSAVENVNVNNGPCSSTVRYPRYPAIANATNGITQTNENRLRRSAALGGAGGGGG